MDYEFLELPGTSCHPNRRCFNGAMMDVRNQPRWGVLETPGKQPHALRAREPEAEMQRLHHEMN